MMVELNSIINRIIKTIEYNDNKSMKWTDMVNIEIIKQGKKIAKKLIFSTKIVEYDNFSDSIFWMFDNLLQVLSSDVLVKYIINIYYIIYFVDITYYMYLIYQITGVSSHLQNCAVFPQ